MCACGVYDRTAAFVLAFGDVDPSAVVSALNRGSSLTCQYEATLAGPQNALQITYRVEISSVLSALFSGACYLAVT